MFSILGPLDAPSVIRKMAASKAPAAVLEFNVTAFRRGTAAAGAGQGGSSSIGLNENVTPADSRLNTGFSPPGRALSPLITISI
jgi:hypothetical protein